MKYFILIIIGLITLVIITSCGLIQTTEIDKEVSKFSREYSGIYVFDKKLRDEIKQREKEREEMRQKVTTGDTFWEQMEAIDKTHPQILSNGCKYFAKGLSVQEDKEIDLNPYKEKIKEYMGDEVYSKLKDTLRVTSYYVDKNNKVIPITMYTYIYVSRTTYGLYGDEGAGFRLTQGESYDISKGIIFYFINGKFIKSDERGKGARY